MSNISLRNSEPRRKYSKIAKCWRCGHIWVRRTDTYIVQCPQCRGSQNWEEDDNWKKEGGG